jgi:hypothetical protein
MFQVTYGIFVLQNKFLSIGGISPMPGLHIAKVIPTKNGSKRHHL